MSVDVISSGAWMVTNRLATYVKAKLGSSFANLLAPSGWSTAFRTCMTASYEAVKYVGDLTRLDTAQRIIDGLATTASGAGCARDWSRARAATMEAIDVDVSSFARRTARLARNAEVLDTWSGWLKRASTYLDVFRAVRG